MIKYLSIIIALSTDIDLIADTRPLITLIFVIDQFPYRYTTQLKKNIRTGIKRFEQEGVVFKNAHHVQAQTATCVGHTALNTGAYGDTHGIVGNTWYEHGKKVACDDDAQNLTPVINPRGGYYNYSKSPHAILVDGISDQFVLAETPDEPHASYSFGTKSRATIATANKCGTPFWIDTESGMFTTSTAYLKTLPSWLDAFNKTHPIPTSIEWKQKYPDINAYPQGSDSYAFRGSKTPLVNSTITVNTQSEEPYEAALMTPYANKMVLDGCCACMDNFFAEHKDGRLMIWACLGSLDKIGHIYGAYSKEIWDMIYWLDDQIEACRAHAEQLVGAENVLSILSSDHGVPPIPEELHARGLTNSTRLDANELIKEVNECIHAEFGIPNVIHDMKNNSFYFTNAIHEMPASVKKKIAKRIQQQLQLSPYIAHAWLPEELDAIRGPITTTSYRFHRQLFRGRSGDIIIETRPYVLLTMRKNGVGHLEPYTYNTHVPLMFLWPRHLEPTIIEKRLPLRKWHQH